MVDLNRENYNHKMNIVALTHVDESVRKHENDLFKKDLNKRWIMVASEGAVFFALLLIGINQTRKAFKKEFLLSRQQKNFLLSITHEFKSPLAAIKLSLQTIRKHSLDAQKRQELIDQSLRETERIQNLIENALTAAQLDNKSIELNRVEFNLTELIQEIIVSKSGQAKTDHPISHQLADNVYLFGDPLAIHSAIINLIENAEKYAPANSGISIELIERDKHIILRILDEGPGIPADEKEKVFQKFYRVENEETRRFKGTGLGLYIVQNIVGLHRGKIFIKSNKPTGTIFEVVFKK